VDKTRINPKFSNPISNTKPVVLGDLIVLYTVPLLLDYQGPSRSNKTRSPCQRTMSSKCPVACHTADLHTARYHIRLLRELEIHQHQYNTPRLLRIAATNSFGDALAHALEVVVQRDTTPERVTIFSDAQTAIRRMASDEPGPGQRYALQAQKHIATLRRARPGIMIEIRWCPAHKGVAGNEKADEWAKTAAGEPNTRGVERPSSLGRTEARVAPLPQSLANLKRGISEKKWAEARQWAGGRTSKKKYQLPKCQRPDGTVAGSTKRLASRFYQLKTGHCLTGQYLNWTKSRPTPQCWWCRYRTQTRDHLFKECPEWKSQQKILWAEVKKETGKWKDRWRVRDLLADRRCSRAVLDFLSTTDVGRRVSGVEVDDAVSAVSELEVPEWMEEQGAVAEEPGAGGEPPLFLPTPDFMASGSV